MGAGASSRRGGQRHDLVPSPSNHRRGAEEDVDWDDVPVFKSDLQGDGVVEHRHSHQDLENQQTFTSDYGKLTLEQQQYKGGGESALRAQAASHWHRIIEHTREERARAHENGEATPCPLCGQMIDDPQFCGFCGDIEEATQQKIAEEEEAAARQNEEGTPGVQWDSTTGTYLRIFTGNNNSASGGSTSSQSPTAGRSSPMSSPGSPSRDVYRHRGSSLIDVDKEKDDMQGVVDILMESSMMKRNRGKGSESQGKNSKTIRERMKRLEQEELEEQQRTETSIARNSPTQRRKFVGLGLDSSDDESTDGLTDAQKKLLAQEDEDNEDDSDQEGDTAWQRSPFYRLLNANTINETQNGFKKVLDKYDEAKDLEEVGEAPNPPLPPVDITLKSRTSDSIELAWDVGLEALQMLEAVRQAYGPQKVPIYQVQYKPHTGGLGAGGSLGTESGKYGSGKGGKPKTSSEWAREGWKHGIRRSKDSGGTIFNLACNTSYQIRCRRVGWSTWEDSVPVVIRSGPGAPGPPRDVKAKEVSSESVLLTWQAPEKDNGLPVTEYTVFAKPYKGDFKQVYKGRERLYLSTDLAPNVVHVFQVSAANKAGRSTGMSERTAVRTLPEGAPTISSWVEVVDEKSHKRFYIHSKTNAVAWTLPSGAILDEAGSFKNKRQYLRNQFARKAATVCMPYGVQQRVMHVNVDRTNLLEASLRILHHATEEDLTAGPVRVKFAGEEGMDAGGLAKDWFIEVAKRLHDDSTGLLTVEEDTGHVTIDPRSAHIHQEAESTRLFRSIGRLVAKAIIDGQTLGLQLDPLLLCLLAGKIPRNDCGENGVGNIPPTLVGQMDGKSILQVTEPQFHKGLMWVIENDVAPADLTFTCSYELFDESQVVELTSYGLTKAVTEENKLEYVELMSNWLLRRRYEPALSSFMEGFEALISIPKSMALFSIKELQLLIGGVPEIDVVELQKTATFGGFVSKSNQVEWLFEVLDDFDHERLSAFLGFISGCPCMPVDGLDPPFLITRAEGEEVTDGTLPRAHTCFNQIVIPRYSSREVLKERVLYALENAAEGFHIA